VEENERARRFAGGRPEEMRQRIEPAHATGVFGRGSGSGVSVRST
jgi:hypothetical protein